MFLESAGHECTDLGPTTYDSQDDYPSLIRPAALAVASSEYDMGIIMGGSGEGEAMAANRVRGVRCTVYYGPAHAVSSVDAEGTPPQDDFEILRLSRQHNDANMLSLAARFLSLQDMQNAVTLWLATPFEGVERHVRRTHLLDES